MQFATRRSARTIVYLSDPMPTRGPGALLEQLSACVGLANGSPIDRLVVDSGSSRTPGGLGANLDALIRSRADAPGRDVLIVEGPHRLASGQADREGAVADLLGAGFILKDGSGELHPMPATTALAAAVAANARSSVAEAKAPAGRARGRRRSRGRRALHGARGHA